MKTSNVSADFYVFVEKEVKSLLENKEQIGIPPKMGDIQPTDEPSKSRPDMTNRPSDGMEINQHQTMMWLNENHGQSFMPLFQEFCKYAMKRLDINKPVTVRLRQDEENAKDLLGYTGYFSPETKEVVVYVSGRAFCDICKSVAHEMTHFKQDLDGRFPENMELGENYAQTNQELRELEKEAYLESNLIYRDFRDNTRKTKQLEEFNAIGSGAVVGYTAPLGMDMSPAHELMWSGDKPKKKKEKK